MHGIVNNANNILLLHHKLHSIIYYRTEYGKTRPYHGIVLQVAWSVCVFISITVKRFIKAYIIISFIRFTLVNKVYYFQSKVHCLSFAL